MTPKEECVTSAERTGWTVTHDDGVSVFEKSGRYMHIRFSERGTIITATTRRHTIIGARKLDKILTELGC